MCVGGVFVRENGFLVKSGGVDTLARIRGKATREKYKGNCTRPGMDVNSGDPSGRDNRPGLIVKQKKPPRLPAGLRRRWVRPFNALDQNPPRRPSEKLPHDPFSRRPKKDCWQPLLRWIKGGRESGEGRKAGGWAGISRNASSIVRHHPRSKRPELVVVEAENTCNYRGLMTRADDGSSGRSRMMRKCHVRFPEKGVATHWSCRSSSTTVLYPSTNVSST